MDVRPALWRRQLRGAPPLRPRLLPLRRAQAPACDCCWHVHNRLAIRRVHG